MIIKDIKSEIANMFTGEIVSKVSLEGADKKNYYCVEVGGLGCFYASDEDIFDELMGNNAADEIINKLCDCAITDYNGIDLSGYEEALSTLNNAKADGDKNLIKLLIYITRAETKDVVSITKEIVGKDIKDIVVPDIDYEC